MEERRLLKKSCRSIISIAYLFSNQQKNQGIGFFSAPNVVQFWAAFAHKHLSLISFGQPNKKSEELDLWQQFVLRTRGQKQDGRIHFRQRKKRNKTEIHRLFGPSLSLCGPLIKSSLFSIGSLKTIGDKHLWQEKRAWLFFVGKHL